MWRTNVNRVLGRDPGGFAHRRGTSTEIRPKALYPPSMLSRHGPDGSYIEVIETPARRSLSDGASFSKKSSLGSPPAYDGYNSPSFSSVNLDTNSERYEGYNLSLRPSPGRGLGLFTNEDIQKGGTVIIERPALVWAPGHEEFISQKKANPDQTWDSIKTAYLQKEVDKLPKTKQGEIWSLYNHPENSKECPLLSIFRTNTFGFSEYERLTGIYIFCARLNHSCHPNCTWSISEISETINPKDRIIRVTALQDIKAGDELTITYTARESRVEERQTGLLRAYGFRCSCPRCIFEQSNLGTLYKWPFDEHQKARLRFSPVRLRHASGSGQGWDFLTTIEHITGEGAISLDDIVTKEKPLILLTKEEMETISSSLIFEKFRQLSSSKRKAYLRLYNWQFQSPASKFYEVDSWPSYDLESSDEEESTGGEVYSASLKRKRPIPPLEVLLDIWTANSFHLGHGIHAVFSFSSHLEHSCSPNCRISWSEEEQALSLVAIKELKTGDQLSICYRPETISHLPVRERQSYLKTHYGFDCSCFRCYLDLSNVSTFGPNIDPLPLSEILAAGEGIYLEPSTEFCNLGQVPVNTGTGRPLEGFEGGSKENSLPDNQYQAARSGVFNEVIPRESRELPRKPLSPFRGSIMGRLGERMRRNQNKY